jgi:hypothetical protein
MEATDDCIGSSNSRLSTGTNIETETLKQAAMLFSEGLFVWLLCATYGVDISPEFF